MQAGSCPRPPRVHRRCGSHPVRATLQQVAVVQQQQQPHNAVGGHIAPEPSTIANGRKVPVRLRQNTHLNGVDVLALQHGATHCEERAVAASKARAHRGQASAHEACLQHAAFTEHVQAQLVAGDGQPSASDPGHSSLLVLLPPPEQDEDEQKLQHSEADTLDHQQVQGDAAVASARCRHRRRRRVRKPSSDEAPASASSLPVDPAAQQLTKAIVAAPGVLELRHLLATATVRLNHIHVSAALKRLTRIAAPSSVQHVVTHVHAPEDASGHASCGGGGPSEPAAQHLHADAAPEQVAGQQQQAGGDAIPLLQRPVQSDWVPQQQLVVSQRGLVVHLAQLAMLHREALAVKDAACIISSLARLRAPVKKSFYLRLMEPLWRRLDTPDVNAWALVELLYGWSLVGFHGMRPDCQRRFFHALTARVHSMDERTSSRALHSLAAMRRRPPTEAGRKLVTTFVRHLPAAHVRDLVNAAWAVAALKLDAPGSDVHAIHGRAAQLLPLMDARETAVLLWSAAVNGYCTGCGGSRNRAAGTQHADTWRAAGVAAAEHHLATGVRGHSLSLLVYALGLLRWRVNEALLQRVLQAAQADRFVGHSSLGLALLLYGLVLLDFRPSEQWLTDFTARLQQCPPRYMHCAVPGLVQAAFTALGFKPPPPPLLEGAAAGHVAAAAAAVSRHDSAGSLREAQDAAAAAVAAAAEVAAGEAQSAARVDAQHTQSTTHHLSLLVRPCSPAPVSGTAASNSGAEQSEAAGCDEHCTHTSAERGAGEMQEHVIVQLPDRHVVRNRGHASDEGAGAGGGGAVQEMPRVAASVQGSTGHVHRTQSPPPPPPASTSRDQQCEGCDLTSWALANSVAAAAVALPSL